MFKFLKDKLKSAISNLGKKAEEEAVEEVEETIEDKEDKIKELEKEKEELEKKEKEIEEQIEEKEEEAEEVVEEKKVVEKPAEPAPKPEKLEPEVPKSRSEASRKPKKVEKKPVEKPKEKEPEPKEEVKELEEEKKEIKEEIREVKAEKKEVEKEKKGFLSKLTEKITKAKISEANFEKLFWDLEVVLLENNMAVEIIEKIKNDLKENIVDKPIPRGKTEKIIIDSLKKSLTEVLSVEPVDLLAEIKKKKPYVLCFIGVNGSGKTTSIAKVVQYLKKNNLSCVIAASDTFRAAAIDQMQEHADNLDVKLIKHDYGADAAAVAFDAVKHAEAKGKDVVLIDTAGRMHSNSNLMDEMKKIVRVSKPDMKIFVGESIVGNDCIEQAKNFDEAVGIDGIILSKADVDEKGGAAISISYVTKKPIIFIGTGQEYDDLKAFEPDIVLESLGL